MQTFPNIRTTFWFSVVIAISVVALADDTIPKNILAKAPVQFGEQSSGALASVWIDQDQLLLGGLDNIVRRYSVPGGPGVSATPTLVESYVEGSRHLTLSERSGAVLSLAWDPKSKRILVGSSDFQARIWPFELNHQLRDSNGVPVFSQNLFATDCANRWFATATSQQIDVWKMSNGAVSETKFACSVGQVTSFGVISDRQHEKSDLIVAGIPDGLLRIVGIEPKTIDETLQVPSADVNSKVVVATSHQYERVTTCSCDGVLREWNLGVRQPAWKIPDVLKSKFSCMSGDRRRLVLANKTAGVWAMTICRTCVDDAPLDRVDRNDDELNDLRFITTDGRGALTAYIGRYPVGEKITFLQFEGLKLSLFARVDPPNKEFGEVLRIALNDSGDEIAVCDEVGRIYQSPIDRSDASWTPDWKFLGCQKSPRTVLRYLGNGDLIVSAGMQSDGTSGMLSIWNWRQQSLVHQVTLPAPVTLLDCVQLEVSPDTYRLAAGFESCDQSATNGVWIATLSQAGTEVRIQPYRDPFFLNDSFALSSISLSTDGQRLITTSSKSGDAERTLCWDLNSRNARGQMPIGSQAFDFQGTGPVRAWLLTDGRTMLPLAEKGDLKSARFVVTQVDQCSEPTDRVLLVDADGPGVFYTKATDAHRVVYLQKPTKSGSWDFSGAVARKVAEHQQVVNAVLMAPVDGKSKEAPGIITGSADRTVKYWPLTIPSAAARGVRTDAELLPTKSIDLSASVLSIALTSTSGKTADPITSELVVAAGLSDGTYAVLDLESPLQQKIDQQRVLPQPPGDPVNAKGVAFLPNGTTLIVGSDLGHVYSRSLGPDVRFGKLCFSDDLQVTTSRTHAGFVNAVAWSPDGDFVATGSADGCTRVWKVQSKVDPPDDGILIHQLDKLLVAQSDDLDFFQRPLIDPKPKWESRPVYSLNFLNRAGKIGLISQAANHKIGFWTFGENNSMTSLDLPGLSTQPDSDVFLSCTVSASSDYVAASTLKGRVFLWALLNGSPTGSVIPIVTPNPASDRSPNPIPDSNSDSNSNPIFGIAFSPDKSKPRLAAISQAGWIDIHELDKDSKNWRRVGVANASTIVNGPTSFTGVTWTQSGKGLLVTHCPEIAAQRSTDQNLPRRPTAMLFSIE